MRVTLEQTGGFAGISKPPIVVDTSTLDPEEARRLRALVADAAFFALPTDLVLDRVVPDSFGYTLTILDDDGREHSVSFANASAQEGLRLLVSTIRQIARGSSKG